MSFTLELGQVLPADLPQRSRVVQEAARHLDLIVEANQHLNLTRITTPREAAIKHVLDSVWPWRHFAAAEIILDAGTGAGFPGIPLSLVFPGQRFVLSESIQKKARFVESAVTALALSNVEVVAQRAEELLRVRRVDVITARAVAPLDRAIALFAPAIQGGARVLLYKGPDAAMEIAAAAAVARSKQVNARLVEEFALPDALGARTLVEISRAPHRASGSPSRS